MKKIAITNLLFIIATQSFAQNISSTEILVRHDTAVLKAAECKWIIFTLDIKDEALKNDIGKSIPQKIFEAIKKNKLKAVDPVTGNIIPANEIYTWQLPVDTVAAIDAEGNHKYNLVQQKHNSDDFSLIKIYQDWFFDIETGKFKSVINYVELLEEIHTTSSGVFIGYKPFCRIHY